MKHSLLISAFVINAAYVSAQFQADVRLTDDNARSENCYSSSKCVGADGSNVYAVWSDERNGADQIYFKKSSDGGATWGADFRFTNSAEFSVQPTVVASGSFVHVVWMDNRDGNYEIYYKRSTDAGVSWGTDTRLTNQSDDSQSPSVAVSGANVYITWYDERDGNREVYFKGSGDNGATWGTDTRITNTSEHTWYPSIASNGNNVYITWYDASEGSSNDIFFRASSNNGTDWGTVIHLESTGDEQINPAAAASGSFVHIAWVDDRDPGSSEIYYNRSTDGGVSFGASSVRISNNTALSDEPSFVVSGNDVYLFWTDERDAGAQFYYVKSNDNGATWGAETALTSASGARRQISGAASAGVIHLGWQDYRDSNFEIYYKKSGAQASIGSTLQSESFDLFPNPTAGIVHILHSNLNGKTGDLNIYNAIGQRLHTARIQGSESVLDISFLSPGTYFVTFNQQGSVQVNKKLVITN